MRIMSKVVLLGIISCGASTAFQHNNVLSRLSDHVNELVSVDVKFRISFKDVVMTNSIINQCLRKIEKEQSFHPLLSAWHDIQKFYRHDEKVLCQFCVVLLLSYHFIITHKVETPNKKLLLVTLLSLYAQLNAIPLYKLFEALEECLEKYNEISNALAPYKDEPFYLWVQNNWWVPAALVGFTFISYMRWKNARLKHS